MTAGILLKILINGIRSSIEQLINCFNMRRRISTITHTNAHRHTSRSHALISKQSGRTLSTPTASLCDPWGGREGEKTKEEERREEKDTRKGVGTRLRDRKNSPACLDGNDKNKAARYWKTLIL